MRIVSAFVSAICLILVAQASFAESHTPTPATEPVVITPAPFANVDMQELLIPGALLLTIIALTATADSDTGTGG